ncbi:pyridoxal phosphate-dependent transferase [Umbelopsis sp. AD052]|nr:pyridoxal phosphate-dependent transferase [Umbelopsis sp. AD052]
MEGVRFFGLITGGTTPASIVGDFLATLYDLNVSLHLPKETNAVTIEQLALDMVLDLCHIPREAYPGKLLTTGATASNTMGMMIARQWVGKKRFNIDIAEDGFCGKVIKVIGGRAHSSVIKAVGVAGLGRGNYIDVSLDQRGYKWDLDKMETILKAQMNGDSEGSIVVVGCGEINTGGFTTDIDKIRALCTRYDAWLHIDAAFGLYARAMPSHASLAANIELGDSMTSDGHKWLNVPYDCGLFYTKHIDMCSEVFGGAKSAYLDTGKTSIPQPLSVGIENSRRFRALPLYMSLLTYGAKGYQEVFESNCNFAVSLGEWIDQHPDLELLAPVYLHTVLFRVTAKSWSHPEGNDQFIEAIKGTEKVYVTKTVWDGQPAIRAAMSNWRTELDRDLPIVQQGLEEALQSRTA